MIKSKTTIIVGGFLALFQAGGAVWDYIQYPLGLHLMGYDVYYIEDTKLYPIFTSIWNDSKPTIKRLQSIMESFGLQNRWIYRDEATNKIYGKSEKEYIEICNRAEIFLNISCANVAREEYSKIPVRILLDSDPMFTQIQINSGQSFTEEESSLANLADWHTHHFTFGENINKEDCLIPKTNFDWQVTRQPICLDFWENKKTPMKSAPFTTLMNWKAGKPLIFNHQTWGQKNITFPLISDLPDSLKNEKFKIAINGTGRNIDNKVITHLRSIGWDIVSSEQASGNHLIYKSFILDSKSEISVAKETYVKAKTGWFSCRSACYLAAGRPVVTQDTGWSMYYPTGKGLFAFTNKEEAIEAINQISTNWHSNSVAAREIAHDYFDHNIVLENIIKSV